MAVFCGNVRKFARELFKQGLNEKIYPEALCPDSRRGGSLIMPE
jgi:hypothetical protein